MPGEQQPNDFSPKKGPDGKQKPPKVHAFVKPDLEVKIDEQEGRQTGDTALVCRCDKVCTCDTVATGNQRCRCDTVSKCVCESVSKCTCDTVMVCSCDTVKSCTCQSVCSCNSHSPGGGGGGGGGGRVCRCVPVRAH